MIQQLEDLSAKQSFQQTIAELIGRSGKTQVEIARALGYENANIMTMFKKGSTRLPAEGRAIRFDGWAGSQFTAAPMVRCLHA